MNYSLLCVFFRNKKKKVGRTHARTGMYPPELLISFLVLFSGRTLNSAPLPSLSAESNSRWKPAAVGCGRPVDVLERGFGDLTNISQD